MGRYSLIFISSTCDLVWAWNMGSWQRRRASFLYVLRTCVESWILFAVHDRGDAHDGLVGDDEVYRWLSRLNMRPPFLPLFFPFSYCFLAWKWDLSLFYLGDQQAPAPPVGSSIIFRPWFMLEVGLGKAHVAMCLGVSSVQRFFDYLKIPLLFHMILPACCACINEILGSLCMFDLFDISSCAHSCREIRTRSRYWDGALATAVRCGWKMILSSRVGRKVNRYRWDAPLALSVRQFEFSEPLC